MIAISVIVIKSIAFFYLYLSKVVFYHCATPIALVQIILNVSELPFLK